MKTKTHKEVIEGKEYIVNTYPSGQQSWGIEIDGKMKWFGRKPLTNAEKLELDEKIEHSRRKAQKAILGLSMLAGHIADLPRDLRELK